ncbi:MAG: hypothetical protein AAB642_02495 [Patescibacteria group bacterium]
MRFLCCSCLLAILSGCYRVEYVSLRRPEFPKPAGVDTVVVKDCDCPVPPRDQVYGYAGDDPSAVGFVNETPYRAKIEVDGGRGQTILVGPYDQSQWTHFNQGRHKLKIIIERPTKHHGIWRVVREQEIEITPSSHPQVIVISEP